MHKGTARFKSVFFKCVGEYGSVDMTKCISPCEVCVDLRQLGQQDNNDNCEMCMDNGINIDRRVKSERIRLIRILEIMASDEKLNTDFTDLN